MPLNKRWVLTNINQHDIGIEASVSYILRSEDSGYFVAVLANEEEFPSGALAFNIMSLVDKD